MNVKELDNIYKLPVNSNKRYVIYSMKLNVIKNGRWAYKYILNIIDRLLKR